MAFRRRKDRPYEVPDEVAGARTEIDDFRARMRQQAGGDAKVNPELEKLKEQYDTRYTDPTRGEAGGEGPRSKEEEVNDLIGKGDFNPFVSKGSFATPDDTTPSSDVPGLESRARPPARAGGGAPAGTGQYQCDDCSASFKERWTTCPKCGGKVNKAGVDPEVEQLRAGTEAGLGGVRQMDDSAGFDSVGLGPVPEFAREETGGVKAADDLLSDLTDMDAPSRPAADSEPRADGFSCNDCGTEYKEKWGKCPKCGGNIERSRAPTEIDQIEERHQAIDAMEATDDPPSSSPSSGSSMLDDLLGGGPSTPPPEEPKPIDLPDLSAPPPSKLDPVRSTPPPDEMSGGDFKASDGGLDDLGPGPSTEMGDLLGEMDLPDEKDDEPEPMEEIAPESAAPESTARPLAQTDEMEEEELTMENVGVRQAEMGEDFSFRRPRLASRSEPGPSRPRTGGTKKIKRKVPGKRSPTGRPSRPQTQPQRRPTRMRRPAPEAPPDKIPTSKPAFRPPPPDEMKSDLLDMLKKPAKKERRQ